ncbi:hypothetical protein FKW77_010039 [Venturia effusa]|uniref:Endonuclease/exonuclease/phosphatase domain-containing protein n=1 Tax=Venturia effusa TaxID=50376 RepID=A0A517L8B8_9PEZI|nr:hypothetical protein FKW77_010039 [Venturia effusa]
MATTLRVLTLNCWGLKYISKCRNERLSQIGTEIASQDPPPSIVALQECWTQQDYNAIRDRTQHILPYGKFYWSGIFGGGLAILSQWPIEESKMVRYALNGRPTAFFRGDWFVGKGVACAKIRLGAGPERGRVVAVFSTHLHAPYETEPNDSYICHRTAQAWEIAGLMRSAYAKGQIVLAMGDFNMTPLSLAHQIVETHGRASDAWRIHHPNSSIGAAIDAAEKTRGVPIPDAAYNLSENGATCDSILNTWRWNKGQQQRLKKGDTITIDPSTKDPRAKRLDYIFFADALQEYTITSVNVGMTMRHPTLQTSLSDHFSVEATLEKTEKSQFTDDPQRLADLLTSGELDRSKHLPVETYNSILAMIKSYEARERRQRRLRLSHFGAQLTVAIGCLVAVWWSPRNYVAFILMLLSTLGLSAGVIDGLIGGLFVGSELRALKEFEWDIRNARGVAAASEPVTGTAAAAPDAGSDKDERTV